MQLYRSKHKYNALHPNILLVFALTRLPSFRCSLTNRFPKFGSEYLHIHALEVKMYIINRFIQGSLNSVSTDENYII